ncbi:MAG: hypothetical protein EB078_01550 [Proteobacteria bacterium]|nr:hypothetical protein [Pseudomonadota bacterium]NDC23387.1 hypothetical protein [Pseudomonadota bacterium]NDD03565.1 hypothetical protein [Pseudomonadota bacterium]NDG26041.1 hypothetical protein [Pseudomonadota bacterium]
MFSTIHFFQSAQELPGLFDSFFSGIFLVRGLAIFFQVGLLSAFALTLFSSYRFSLQPSGAWKRLASGGAFLTLVLSAFLIFQPWDELFIFLRHSKHLAENGIFSFNRFEKSEGIVDFLPFFVLGLLAKLGLPLLETNFAFGILGSWLCVTAARRLLIELKVKGAEVWAYPLLVVYPPLLLNMGNGFTVLLFTASLLWSLNFLFFDRKPVAGWFLLSLVPLIRIEGLWFTLLVLVFSFKTNRFPPNKSLHVLISIGVFIPAFFLTLWRLRYFGHYLPVPVRYKSAIGNGFYALIGARNLFLDLLASLSVIFIWHWFIFPKQRVQNNEQLRLAFKLWGLLLIFCMPYYFSGGDWFPPAWGRYLFPFSFFGFILFITLFESCSTDVFKRQSYFQLLNAVLLIILTLLPFGSISKSFEVLFTPKKSLSGLHQKKTGKSNFRLQQLSQLGTHLKNTTSPTAQIASSELATIMYFAERETLDLLGVTNSDIASSPLRTPPKLFSKATRRNELPYLIFKRLKPELIAEKRPSIVYAFDFLVTDLIENRELEEINDSDIFLALSRWERRFQGLNDELFGGMTELKRIGYAPVVVKYGVSFYALYFVSPQEKEDHFQRMKQHGLIGTLIRNNRL